MHFGNDAPIKKDVLSDEQKQIIQGIENDFNKNL